jgi:hypothetical protein
MTKTAEVREEVRGEGRGNLDVPHHLNFAEKNAPSPRGGGRGGGIWDIVCLAAELMEDEVTKNLVPLRDDNVADSRCCGSSRKVRRKRWSRGVRMVTNQREDSRMELLSFLMREESEEKGDESLQRDDL